MRSLRFFKRYHQQVRLVSKVIGPLQIGLLERPLGLLEEPARPFKRTSLGWRQPFAAETQDSFFNSLLQPDHLVL